MKKIPRDIKKILIFGHSNIGDVCYDLLVAGILREKFPQAKISFVTSVQTADIAAEVSDIDEVIVFDKRCKDKGFFGYARFINKIRSKKFDLGIILRNIKMHCFFNISFQFKSDASDKQTHPVLKYVRLLEKQGIVIKQEKLMVHFTREEKSFNPEGFCVGIMPFSAWKLKCWPIEKWNQLISYLTVGLGATVYVFGRTGESLWEKKFVELLSDKASSLVNKCTLPQSLGMVQRMNLFIGVDTSLLHFASCMRIPAIGLYGPTDKEVFYPFFHKNFSIVSDKPLKCAPCYRHSEVGPCGVKDEPAQCMINISVEQVVEKVRKALDKTQVPSRKSQGAKKKRKEEK